MLDFETLYKFVQDSKGSFAKHKLLKNWWKNLTFIGGIFREKMSSQCIKNSFSILLPSKVMTVATNIHQ